MALDVLKFKKKCKCNDEFNGFGIDNKVFHIQKYFLIDYPTMGFFMRWSCKYWLIIITEINKVFDIHNDKLKVVHSFFKDNVSSFGCEAARSQAECSKDKLSQIKPNSAKLSQAFSNHINYTKAKSLS